MAEGLLSALTGGEDEAEEAGESAAPVAGQGTGSDALAAAIAVGQAGYGPGVAAAAESFLRKQAALVADQAELARKQSAVLDIQAQHLRHEHRVRLALLRGQRQAQRMRIGLQFFTILILTAIAIGFLAMVNAAATSRAVVVEPFKVPASLVERGLTGEVVASGILDMLRKLQAATRGTAKALNTLGAWTSDIKVEVPETGISVGEIDRLLHDALGQDFRVEGELVALEGGRLALTVRGGGVPAQTFTGPAGELDRLTTQAAEYVYGRSQPLQYIAYLLDLDRDANALAFIPGAYARAANDEERAELANDWGNAYSDLGQGAPAAEKFRLAMSLKHNNWRAWDNLVNATQERDGEEAAWREAQAFLRAAEKAPADEEKPLPREYLVTSGTIWDMPLQLTALLAEANLGEGAGTMSGQIVGPNIADTYAQMHDPANVAKYMLGSDPDDPFAKAEAQLLEVYAALDHGDAAAAVKTMEALSAMWQAKPSLLPSNDYFCYLGLVYGLAGRAADAEAAFAKAGDWTRCYAYRGTVLDHAGDRAGAERVWAAGIAAAPDPPIVYLYRGLSEAAHGDLDRAGDDFKTANNKAPHWADPLKAWGDLLVRRGARTEAVAKYDEALKYAPAWEALHQARDAVAANRS